jgi:hypothetical protein
MFSSFSYFCFLEFDELGENTDAGGAAAEKPLALFEGADAVFVVFADLDQLRDGAFDFDEQIPVRFVFVFVHLVSLKDRESTGGKS